MIGHQIHKVGTDYEENNKTNPIMNSCVWPLERIINRLDELACTVKWLALSIIFCARKHTVNKNN